MLVKPDFLLLLAIDICNNQTDSETLLQVRQILFHFSKTDTNKSARFRTGLRKANNRPSTPFPQVKFNNRLLID